MYTLDLRSKNPTLSIYGSGDSKLWSAVGFSIGNIPFVATGGADEAVTAFDARYRLVFVIIFLDIFCSLFYGLSFKFVIKTKQNKSWQYTV